MDIKKEKIGVKYIMMIIKLNSIGMKNGMIDIQKIKEFMKKEMNFMSISLDTIK